MQFVNMYRVDLTGGPAVVPLKQMFYGDAGANRIGAIVTDGGEEVQLSGTCGGTAVLANGGTVVLTGTVSGSEAYVELPAAAYAVEGAIQVFVYVEQSGQITTLVAGFGNVRMTDTDTIIDPGTVVPSLSELMSKIAEMEAATVNANAAAANATESAEAYNAIITELDGTVYTQYLRTEGIDETAGYYTITDGALAPMENASYKRWYGIELPAGTYTYVGLIPKYCVFEDTSVSPHTYANELGSGNLVSTPTTVTINHPFILYAATTSTNATWQWCNGDAVSDPKAEGVYDAELTRVDELDADVSDLKSAVQTLLNKIVNEVRSANLVNPAEIEDGGIGDDGAPNTARGYYRSSVYIQVLPSTAYSEKYIDYVCEYKEDKTFINRRSVNDTGSTITTGSQTYFVKLVSNNAPLTTPWRFNEGSTLIDEDYVEPRVEIVGSVDLRNILDDSLSESGKAADANATGEAINAVNDGLSETSAKVESIVEYSQNIADNTDTVAGYIASDGSIGTGSGYVHTDNYIPVVPGAYTLKSIQAVATYNSEKGFIERLTGSESQKAITIGSNVAYVRFSSNTDLSGWRFNAGDTLVDYPYHKPYLGQEIKLYHQMSDILTYALPNMWRGKKYAAIGDSITEGFIPRNDPGYPGTLNSYAKLVSQKLGMTFSNYGISGSSLAYVDGRNPMSRRYSNLPNDADLITFLGGANDIRNGVQLGTMADRTDATYYGALHVLIGGLYKKYMIDQGTEIGKTKHIVALTPIKLLDPSSSSSSEGEGTLENLAPWAEAVKEVAAYYSIPCFDFYNLSGINPHLDRTVHGTESGYTGYYNPYITDGTHPTQDGQEIMANALCGFLKTLM